MHLLSNALGSILASVSNPAQLASFIYNNSLTFMTHLSCIRIERDGIGLMILGPGELLLLAPAELDRAYYAL